jgi:K+-sensing histidine kinase KdpD
MDEAEVPMTTTLPPLPPRPRRRWLPWTGPLATLAIVVGLEALERIGLGAPNPSVIYLLGIVYAAFVGGAWLGLLSVALAVLGGSIAFAPPGAVFADDPTTAARLAVLSAAGLGAALLVGTLRHWAERGAVAERMAALSAERAELLAREREARSQAEAAMRRADLLAKAGTTLAESLDIEATVAALTELIVPALADWCVVDLCDEAGELRILAAAHVEPDKEELIRRLRAAYPIDVTAAHGPARALRTGQPEFFPSIEDAWRVAAARDPEHLALMRALDARSSIAAPLLARGRTLGLLTLVATGSDRGYSPVDVELAMALAQRAALALDNARLFQETQAALRARDTFLSIASHELRTPVTSIKGFVQVLMRHQERGRLAPEQLVAALPVISRGAERLAVLIEDLLDVSRIRLGRLLLRLQPVDLTALVRAVVARRQFDGRAIAVTGADAAPLLGDADRLEQVIENVDRDDGWVVVVQDLGIGLPDGAAEAIFEPFGKAANAARQQLPGLGLGLYICRMIVEQHGGRITAASPGEDAGTTVSVWLPRAPGGAGADREPAPFAVADGAPPPAIEPPDAAPQVH